MGAPGLASETWEREEGEANPISGVSSDETSDELQSPQEEFLKEVEASQNDLSCQCRFNCRGRRINPELLKQVDSLILRQWTAEGGMCEDPFWVASSPGFSLLPRNNLRMTFDPPERKAEGEPGPFSHVIDDT